MIDFADPAFLADPYPVLSAVREETPVFALPDPRRPGVTMWFLTRHEDVVAAQRDRRLGRVRGSRPTPEDLGIPAERSDLAPYVTVERWSLLMLEPPDHTRLRRLVGSVFTPRRIAGLRPALVRHADRFLEAAMAGGEFDLLADYVQPYSVHVVAELMGAPTGDWRRMLEWSHAIVKMYELRRSEEQIAAAVRASGEFATWCRSLIARRRAAPTEDLVSALCLAETEEGRLSDDEIVSTLILLLNAGHEATVNTMGNGVTELLRDPERWAAVVSGAVAPDVAVEEMLRYDPPLQLFERWVREDGVEYGGRRIPRGDKIAMLFGSANRDPRRFPEPDRFDVARGDPSHVSFGGGIHHCLGAPLARLELAVALERLALRAPGVRPREEPPRQPTFVIHGYREVPLVL